MGPLPIRFLSVSSYMTIVSVALLRHGVIQQTMERDPNEEDRIEDFRNRAHGDVPFSLASQLTIQERYAPYRLLNLQCCFATGVPKEYVTYSYNYCYSK